MMEDIYILHQGGTGKFAIGLESSGADLTFNSGAGVSPIERVRFASNGTVGIGGTTILVHF